jgi:hypothetical protein
MHHQFVHNSSYETPMKIENDPPANYGAKELRPTTDSPELYGSEYTNTKRAILFGSKLGMKQTGQISR